MSDLINQVLGISNVEEYRKIKAPEYLFHEALESGRLKEVLAKFPRAEIVHSYIMDEVINFEGLKSDWKEGLLKDVNNLIDILPVGTLERVSHISDGEVDLNSEEMAKLRGELGYELEERSQETLAWQQSNFLNDFFFGVDFTHWVKIAIQLKYTDLSFEIPYILNARRNGLQFSVCRSALHFEARS